MPQPADPVLSTVLGLAASAMSAAAAWVVAVVGDGRLAVVAAAGAAAGREGRPVPADTGSAAYATSSGQPLAVAPRPGDDLGATAPPVIGRQPSAVLSVPCDVDGTVVGVLELVDKPDGGRFTFDDVEVVTMLAEVAAAALARSGRGPAVATPDELADGLARLAEDDPVRYAAVAAAIEALLGGPTA